MSKDEPWLRPGKCDWCEAEVDHLIHFHDQPDFHDADVCEACCDKYGWNKENVSPKALEIKSLEKRVADLKRVMKPLMGCATCLKTVLSEELKDIPQKFIDEARAVLKEGE